MPEIPTLPGVPLPAEDMCGQLETSARQLTTSSDPDRLILENAAEFHYECLQRRACAFKFASDEEDFLVLVSSGKSKLDMAQELDEDALACRERYGLLDRKLFEMLPTIASNEHLSIALLVGDAFAPTALPEIDSSTGLPVVSTELHEIAQILDDRGYGQFYPVPGFNFLFGQASPITISRLGAAQDLPGVIRITELPVGIPRLHVSGAMIASRKAHESGFTGKGVKVAVMEADTIDFEAAGDLPIAARYSALFTGSDVDLNNHSLGCIHKLSPLLDSILITDHGDGVAEVLCGGDPIFRGIAPDVSAWGGGGIGFPERQVDTILSKRTFGTAIMNHSYASGGSVERTCVDRALSLDSSFVDYVTSFDILSVASAGNPPGDKVVCDPAAAYNVIAVAGYSTGHKLDTAGLKIMTPSLPHPESTFDDRYGKPEVSAPWEDLVGGQEPTGTIRKIGSGTSYASPMVAGIAALVREANSRVSPWLSKAIIMATAIQKVGGAKALGSTGWPRDVDKVRSAEPFFGLEGGVGGVRADLAPKLAQEVGGIARDITVVNCEPAETKFELQLAASQRIRVVMAWDVNPYYPHYLRRPTADFDLNLLDSNGKTIASSVSFDNSTEAFDVKVPAAGTYTIEIVGRECVRGKNAKYAPKRIGLAAYTGSFDEPDLASLVAKKATVIRRFFNTYCLMAEAPTGILKNKSLEVTADGKAAGKVTTGDDGCALVEMEGAPRSLKLDFKGDRDYLASSANFDLSVKRRADVRLDWDVKDRDVRKKPGDTWRATLSLTSLDRKLSGRKVEFMVLGPFKEVPEFYPKRSVLSFAKEAKRVMLSTSEDGTVEIDFDIPARTEPGEWFIAGARFFGDTEFTPKAHWRYLKYD